MCQTNGNTYLAKGALFNYYEFLSDKRLTNHEWQTMVGVKRAAMVYDQEKNIHVPMDVYDKDGKRFIDEDEYDFENIIITGPSENMVPKPAWTESFISPEENRVTINHIKVNWE